MNSEYPDFSFLLNIKPQAMAKIMGSESFSSINGEVWFYQTEYGVLVVSDIEGLPNLNKCASPIFAYHIHEGSSCSGDMADTFKNSMTHYNPHNCPHPYHAGDLPPLMSVNGNAFSIVLTARFKVNEIIGKTIIIHSSVDDFTTQPSGNSGEKIACGEIVAVK